LCTSVGRKNGQRGIQRSGLNTTNSGDRIPEGGSSNILACAVMSHHKCQAAEQGAD